MVTRAEGIKEHVNILFRRRNRLCSSPFIFRLKIDHVMLKNIVIKSISHLKHNIYLKYKNKIIACLFRKWNLLDIFTALVITGEQRLTQQSSFWTHTHNRKILNENVDKTKLMTRTNGMMEILNITVNGKPEVTKFRYIRSLITSDGRTRKRK